MMDFSKFDERVNDLAGLQKDIENAAAGIVERVEIPEGNYEVKIEKMELKESKKGDPMVSIWFRIVAGEYERQMLFMNQVITPNKPFQFHIVNELLRSMETGLDIHFESYTKYAELLEDVFACVDKQKTFELECREKRGFMTYKIVNVFNL